MTFETTAWAIDGALLGSSLARRAEYAAVGGAEGIVQKPDLKVTQLDTPGVGVKIAPGVGLVNNKYQTSPNETYVVSNPGSHTIPAIEMPASNPSAKSYIVAVVVGDPDFSQAGHPFMTPSDPPVGEETTFAYVRPVLIEVASSSVKTLSGAYPALVLARIDVPANTTTITNAHITDLRKLARPRQSQEIFVGQPWTNASPVRIPSGSAYGDWGSAQFQPSVAVPDWAKRAIMVVSINGIKLQDASVNASGGVRTQMGSVTGPATSWDVDNSSSGAVRLNLQTAGEYDCSTIAGTTVNLRVEGFENVPAAPSTNQRLALLGGSQMIFDVRFFEE